MSDSALMWIEIIFNISYLTVIWWLVITMLLHRSAVKEAEQRTAKLFILAFGLLALGDTGHVGFRVVAFLKGDLSTRVDFLGFSGSLVGLGALATAFTVTLFYIVMLEIWRTHFASQHGLFSALLLFAGLVRLGLMTLPFNQWDRVVPVQPWSTIRNIPLMILGLGAAALLLIDGIKAQDRTFIAISASILFSYACYIPVILWVHQVPLLGMLMIPKTLAYLVVGLLAYRELYPRPPLAGEAQELN
ncbi:MAG: hypothetical protein U5K99_06510 [Anaerolineales bacterium]|nr:hypothetical protein [Anaerolineales bacterium]